MSYSSYSFTITASNVTEAYKLLDEKFNEVVAQQPSQVLDRWDAEAAAAMFLDVLPRDISRDVCVSVSGWVSVEDGMIRQASVNIAISRVDRKPVPDPDLASEAPAA